MSGYKINDNIRSIVIYSGSLELFHLCNSNLPILNRSLFDETIFCLRSLLTFFVENGVDLNIKNKDAENNVF